MIEEDKIATAMRAVGYNRKKLSDQLEIVGVLENIKNVILQDIKKLGEKHFE